MTSWQILCGNPPKCTLGERDSKRFEVGGSYPEACALRDKASRKDRAQTRWSCLRESGRPEAGGHGTANAPPLQAAVEIMEAA